MPRHTRAPTKPFDLFGYAALALFIASIQLFLDRGPTQDWFSAKEIWFELAFAGVGLYLFMLHTATTEHPFFDPSLLRDSNFVAGCAIAGFVGILVFSAMALLPPMMQQLLGYPVVTSGIVTMPRGIGMLIANIIVGRFLHRFSVRALVLTGLALNALAFWQMSQMSLEMDASLLVVSGFIQGVGISCVFVPLSIQTFAQVTGPLRNEASSIFTLVRNLGSSAGISIMQGLFVANVQAAHAGLAQDVSPDNPMLQTPQAEPFSLNANGGLIALNQELNRQAAMISYLDDFHLAMLLSICAMPLALLLRLPKAEKIVATTSE